MEIPLLTDIVIIFGLSVVVLLLFHFLRLPAVVGLLLTGILAGPYGFGLIKAIHEVEVLAEIGVILLLLLSVSSFPLKNFLKLRSKLSSAGLFKLA